MKILFASDIHGSFYFCKKLVDAFNEEKADLLVLLGDILYHGPRNDLPKEYNPKGVIGLLNDLSEKVICVKGNCDAEVDQMVLNFELTENYKTLSVDGKNFYLTHGHKFNTQNPPPMNDRDVLIHGHTHISGFESFGNNNLFLNPGSVSIPKENTKNGYMIYENKTFVFKDIDGNQLFSKSI